MHVYRECFHQDFKEVSYEAATEYVVNNVIGDTWADAGMDEVLQYLYSNKHLCLTQAQRNMIRGLAEIWE